MSYLDEIAGALGAPSVEDLDGLLESSAVFGPNPFGESTRAGADQARGDEVVAMFLDVGLSESGARDAAASFRADGELGPSVSAALAFPSGNGYAGFPHPEAVRALELVDEVSRRRGVEFGVSEVREVLRGDLGEARLTERLNAAVDAVAGGAGRPTGGTLSESRSSAATMLRLVEKGRVSGAGSGLFSVCLIDEGRGSSGYYPASTLQQAAADRVFAAGTHVYLDHPTQSGAFEQPERSLRDLVGVLEHDATYRDGGLYGTVRVFPQHVDAIAEMAPHIGMSIRADGELGERSVSGAPTVERITKAHSVDFVTRAGRGGRVLGAVA